MKNKIATFALVLFAVITKAQTWNTTLNSGSSAPKFGLTTDHSLGFFTNNIQRLTLTGTGRFGIGTVTPVAELHVVGKGFFTGGIVTQSGVMYSDVFGQKYTPSPYGPDHPNVFYTGSNASRGFKKPCNIWYNNWESIEGQPENSSTFNWIMNTANLFDDILQIASSSVSAQPAAMSMGVLPNGDGIIGLETTNGSQITNQVLKINPGCAVDLNLCEGGGLTRIFNDAWIGEKLDVKSRLRINSFTSTLLTSFEIKTGYSSAINIWNPGVTGTNKRVFEVLNSGAIISGTNITSTTAMLAVGQPVKANKAFVLTDNSQTPNKNYFSVQGNGYTEINVHTPSAMPNNRVLTIYDNFNSRDLFVVKSDGKVYAREVEISLAASFPDYVFENGYDLKPIHEVEKFVTTNKHLPGFEKGTHYETNGVNVTDLMLKQQQQLEEQMLYIIQLEKRLKALEKNNR